MWKNNTKEEAENPKMGVGIFPLVRLVRIYGRVESGKDEGFS
jgi:hypothetical protein